MKVPYVDLPAQYAAQRDEILRAVDETLRSGKYILGEQVARFEHRFAELCGAKHAIGVANGTDALILTLKALGVGPDDEVVTVANSWISTASSVALLGGKPVFADVQADQNMDPESLRRAITPRTKAVIAVHLTGKTADMDPILEIAAAHGLYVIEDAAQAVRARYRGRLAGSLGHAASFSLHPLKNLNASGDAGAVTVNDDALAERLRLLRNHGLAGRNEVVEWGFNSRLDSIQAAILNAKIGEVDRVIAARRKHARRYREALGGLVRCPDDAPDCFDTYHLFVIQCDRRDALKAFLKERGVSTAIHYPRPIHLQPCVAKLGWGRGDLPVTEAQAERILSLPVHHMLNADQVDYVIDCVRAFYGGNGG